MGTRKLSGKPDEMLGGYMRWTSIPSKGCGNTPLESLHAKENWDELQRCGPLGSCTDFTYINTGKLDCTLYAK